ncbi:MAG TPA: hypothetical protein VNM15_05015 [Candidatus Binatia bacterium]|jgi:DNA/RNA endonuclease YhcR with UshA esterase domain|nr:hypothetical protein [Candidatus Binatia bacterium]
MRHPAATPLMILAAFLAGFLAHGLYRRWNPPAQEAGRLGSPASDPTDGKGAEPKSYRVSFAPLPALTRPEEAPAELPVVVAREVEKVRALTGKLARVRGRVYRVGHSAKSNTYFLNFGPSRESLTAVIFASAVELFEKNKMAPAMFENREVEITGTVRDHPQYGLEMIIENPKQIKLVN